MKRYCRQCSVILSGEDGFDLADLKKKDWTSQTTCDGCGFIAVSENGKCLTHKTHLQFFPHLTKEIEIAPGFLEALDKIITDPIVDLPVPLSFDKRFRSNSEGPPFELGAFPVPVGLPLNRRLPAE